MTLKCYIRKSRRRVELHPDCTNPEHKPIQIDLKHRALEIAGVAVGALIGDGFNPTQSDYWVP